VTQRISVVGTGYVGLCTAVAFATKGNQVITSTRDKQKAASINKGTPPFYEPDLEETLQKVVKEGRLTCTLKRQEAVLDTDVTFIAVATPSKQDGSIDLRHIEEATKEIGQALNKKDTYHLVVVKSTVAPGTTENTVKPILEKHSHKHCGNNLGLCMNPEFLREGSALYDTLYPDRIIIGEHDNKSGSTLETQYREFYAEKMPPLIRTNLPTAELIKYASNSLLATKISFINTMANICEKTPGADATTVAKGMGLDKRIGPLFLNAGLGYGGSCFPKDVKALIAYSKNLGYNPKLLETVENVNQTQPYRAIELCKSLIGDLKGKKIAILGLSFKPNTDDMREARSVPIINQLLKEGTRIKAYDPAAMAKAKSIFKNKIRYASSPVECLKDADCCIIVTEWDEFKKLKPEDFKRSMRQPILIDGRRIYNPEEFTQKLKFAAIGLGPRKPDATPNKPQERQQDKQ
jgi:UDPglucose 6-dehydrogenase